MQACLLTCAHDRACARARTRTRRPARKLLAVVAAALATLAAPGSALALDPPTNPSATAGNTTAVLAWTNPGSPDFTDTRIYRRTSPQNAWTLVRTEPKTDPSPETWTDTGLTNLTDYAYVVRSWDGATTEKEVIQGGGLWGTYYDGTAFNTWKGRQLDPGVNLNWGTGKPTLTAGADSWSTKWDGYIYIDFNETYTFYLNKDDGGRLWIGGTDPRTNGTQVVNSWTCGCGEYSGSIALTPGWHKIAVDHYESTSTAYAILSWSSPSISKTVVPADHYGYEKEVYATPTDVGVTVTAPDGGETISAATTNITWSKTGSDTVNSYRLYYSTDGGATWPNFIVGVSGASSSYTWTPPSTYATEYRVKVIAVNSTGSTLASDSSNGNFTIATSPPDTVTKVKAVAGSGQVTLSWVNPTDPRFHHAQVWRSTVEGDPGAPVYTAPDNTVTSWTDLTPANGTTYYYTVRPADSGGTVWLSPVSNGLRQSTYSGNAFGTWKGEQVQSAAMSYGWGNSVYTGLWNGDAAGWFAFDSFTIRYYGLFWAEANGTYTFDTTVRDGSRLYVDNSLVYQTWTTTDCACSASGTIVLTRGWHTIRQDYQETSGDTYFNSYVTTPATPRQIIPSTWIAYERSARATPTTDTVTVTYPNGGESWLGERNETISWTSTAASGSIALRYSTDGGATYPTAIAANLPLNGSFSWSVAPGINSSQVRILAEHRTSATGQPSASDASNANLTIDTTTALPPAVSNVKASAGSTSVLVTWTNPSPAGTFDHAVVYRSTSELDPGVVVNVAAPGATSYNDTGLANGTTYYYRVRGADAAGRQGRTMVAGQVQRSMFNGANFQSFRYREALSGPIDYNWGSSVNVGPSSALYPGWMTWDSFSARQTAYVYIDTAGTYLFDVMSSGTGYVEDGGKLWVDGMQLASTWPNADCNCYSSGALYLTVGWHQVGMEYQDWNGDASYGLVYTGPGVSRQVVPQGKLAYEPVVDATPMVDTISLNAPNGGQVWRGETTRQITWTSSAATGSVLLRYSTDGGATYPFAIASGLATTGSYSWSVPPSISSSQVRIRAELRHGTSNVPTVMDASDADLTIDSDAGALPPAPDGLTVVAGNTTASVTWTNPSPAGTFDHAVVYRSTSELDPGAVVNVAAPGATSFNDSGLSNGVTYYYRVRGADAAGREGREVVASQVRRSVFNGANFQSYRYTEPVAGAINHNWGNSMTTGVSNPQLYPSWFTWDSFSIRWTTLVYIDSPGTYSFDVGSTANNYVEDGGRVFVDGAQVVDTWPDADCNCYSQGPIYLTSGWHDVAVEYQDWNGDASISLQYSGPGVSRQVVPLAKLGYEPVESATPMADTIAVSSPNGGESLLGEASVPITWTSTASSGSVVLRYSTDGGATYPYGIASGQPLNGTFTWTAPAGLNSAQMRVKAELRHGTSNQPTIFDTSNGNFTIDTTAGTLPPPVSGAAATPGSGSVTVSWQNPSPAGTFDHAVVYRSTSEESIGQLVHTAAPGATNWVDGGRSNGTTYWYRVRAADAAGRQSRTAIAGQVRLSAYSGSNFESFRFTDLSTADISYNWGNTGTYGMYGALYPGWMAYDSFSLRFTGLIWIDTAGMYSFDSGSTANGYVEDGARTYVDGTQVTATWPNADCNCYSQGGIYLTQGWHDLVEEYQDWNGDASVSLQYSGPSIARQVVPIAKLGYEPVATATPTADTITLTYPNGGEVWDGETTQQVTWTSTAGTGSALLSYSTDGGATYPYAIASGLTTSGSFSWTLPQTVSSAQVRVRVELRDSVTNQPTVSDASNANLTIDTTPGTLPPGVTGLTVTPGAGSNLVTWTNPAPMGTFDHAVVYRSTSERDPGVIVYTAPSSATTSFNDTGLTNDVTYWYRVRSVTATGRHGRAIVPGQVRRSVYANTALTAYRYSEVLTATISQDWGNSATSGPISSDGMSRLLWDNYGVRYTATAYIDNPGTYLIDAMSSSSSYVEDGARVFVDGAQVAATWPGGDCNCLASGGIYLTAGWHDVALEFADWTGDASFSLHYRGPGVGRQVVPLAKLGYEPVAPGRPNGATISITAPAGGSTLEGESASVAWSTTAEPVGSTIRLRYSLDGGATYPWTITGNAGASPYSWRLPLGVNQSNVRIRAEIVDTSGYVVAVTQTANFTVDTTAPGTITGMGVAAGWNKIQVSWTNPGSPSYHHANIYRSTSDTTLGSKIATVSAPTATYLDTGLTNGTTYYYTVRAANIADVERTTVEAGRFRGDYYTGTNFDGTFKGTQGDTAAINYNWGGGNPAIIGQGDSWSVRWTGYIYLDQSTEWTFDNYDSADGTRLWIDGAKVIEEWYGCDCASYFTTKAYLTQGWHPFTYETHDNTGNARAYLYYARPGLARQIVPAASLGYEVQRSASPTDTTPPVPNPNGQAIAVSATQIDWSAPGASDGIGAGLHATPYSFDGGAGWQVSDTYSLTGLTANTQYSQTVVVRDAATNQTTPRVVSARTLALAPNVISDRSTNTWLGPAAATITFSNNIAWGVGGVQYYRYVFDTSPTHTWTGAEPQWSAGTLPRTAGASGDWYLHVRSYNGDDVASQTADLGPYRVDLVAPAPSPPTVTTTPTTTDITFTVIGASDASSGLDASAYSFDGGGTWQASASYAVTGLTGNQTVSRNIVVRDAVGNVTAATNATATTLPEVPNVTPSPAPDATWRVNGTVITLTSNIAFGPGTIWGYRYKVTQNPTEVVSGADPAWTSGTLPVSLTGTSATWYIHVRSFNADGVGGSTQDLGPYKIDASGPAATNPIAAADPTNVAPQFSWTSVTDSESGLAGYRVYRSTSSGVLGSLLATQAGTSYTDNDTLIDGQRYWYTVRAYDNLGNEQAAGNTQIGISYDSIAPTGNTVTVAGGAANTSNAAVTLTLTSTNATQMLIGNLPDLSDGTWEPYAGSRGWTLTAGDGTKTVYARFKSANNTLSAVVSDSIVLDTTAPTPNPATATANVINATSITWSAAAASDAGAGLPPLPYSFDNGSSWQASTDLVETTLAPNTAYTKNVKLRDAVSNVGTAGTVSATTLPATPNVSSVPAPDGVNTQPLGTTFTFTNDAGFGAGAVQYYRWVWNSSPAAYSFTGAEAMWSASTLTKQEWVTGTYYLHVLAYNSANVAGQQLTVGPYMLAPPTGAQTVYSNVATTQTLACAKTDFTLSLLPGTSDDATIDCTVTSQIAGWNIQVHSAAAPFFSEFADFSSTIQAYSAPTGTNAHVAFTASGAYSLPAYSNGTQWRGFAGLTDVTIGGDTATTAGTVVTNRIRAALGPSAGLTPGGRSQTVTYTLSPGAPS